MQEVLPHLGKRLLNVIAGLPTSMSSSWSSTWCFLIFAFVKVKVGRFDDGRERMAMAADSTTFGCLVNQTRSSTDFGKTYHILVFSIPTSENFSRIRPFGAQQEPIFFAGLGISSVSFLRLFPGPHCWPHPVCDSDQFAWDLGLGVGQGVCGEISADAAAGSLHLTEWRVRALTCCLYR